MSPRTKAARLLVRSARALVAAVPTDAMCRELVDLAAALAVYEFVRREVPAAPPASAPVAVERPIEVYETTPPTTRSPGAAAPPIVQRDVEPENVVAKARDALATKVAIVAMEERQRRRRVQQPSRERSFRIDTPRSGGRLRLLEWIAEPGARSRTGAHPTFENMAQEFVPGTYKTRAVLIVTLTAAMASGLIVRHDPEKKHDGRSSGLTNNSRFFPTDAGRKLLADHRSARAA